MDNPVDQNELLKTLLREQLGAELDLLSQRVKAEQDTANEQRRKNDLEEQALRNVERSRVAEFTRTQLWLNISEQTANLVQQLPVFQLTILGMAEQLEELESQVLRDISQRLDRIERALLLILGGKHDSRQAKQLIDEMEKDEHRRRLLQKKYKTLWQLEEQLADYGLDKPIHLVNQLGNVKQEIDNLENEV